MSSRSTSFSSTSSDRPRSPHKVTFQPPLWLQRRSWALSKIREQPAQTILDIGCGEGSLLEVLTQPALTLPSHSSPFSQEKEPHIDIYATHIAGLELVKETAESAAKMTKPDSPPADDIPVWQRPFPRWQDLKVDIWQGGLEILNGDAETGHFGEKEWDVIVSTEVVEHLPEDVLKHFLPVSLGIYRPNVLLLTTPNYNFNELFTAPGVPREYGFPDPTGATERVFRHDDHQREWTEDEWREWCEAGATAWGYDVEVDSLGMPEEADPYGREAAGKASLTATFRRRGKEDRSVQLRRNAALAEAQQRTKLAEDSDRAHHLVAQHHYHALPEAGKPQPQETILDVVREVLSYEGGLGPNEGCALVDELWRQDEVSTACGGVLDALLTALENADPSEWQLIRQSSDLLQWRPQRWTWQIIWKAFVKAERTPSPEPSEQESYDYNDWPEEEEEEEIEDEDDPRTEYTTSTPDYTLQSGDGCEDPWGNVDGDGWGAASESDWGKGWGAVEWRIEEPTWVA